MSKWEAPEAWVLADALDAVAYEKGWRPTQRIIGEGEVAVLYRKDPLIALVDALPGVGNE